MIKEGDKAPGFTLPGVDADGADREYTLEGLLEGGRPLVLYFYPRDNTPGCTQEACEFRDNMARLTHVASVAGVSRDSLRSHKGFQAKQGLNFPLLSDVDHALHEAYGAWGLKRNKDGKRVMAALRTTVAIGPDGLVTRIWENVKVAGHVDEVLGFLTS